MSASSICGYLWIAWWLTWLVWAFQSKKTIQRESVASAISYRLVAMLGIYFLLSAWGFGSWMRTAILPYRAWIGGLGIAITALGFALTFWSRFLLGRNWSGNVTVKAGHELIRTGPYRLVRHPIYTGIIIALAGTAIAQDQWRGIVAVLLLWLSFTIKRLREEQFMQQTFGPQYVEYCETTGAIFPHLRHRTPN
jgi:protein-S-isoprenylcysteine O-methyltransferase Ste14